jgi:hypothetical protein
VVRQLQERKKLKSQDKESRGQKQASREKHKRHLISGQQPKNGQPARRVIRFKESDIKMRYLITLGGCPDCGKAYEDHLDLIKSGKMKVVDVETDEGFSIINKLGIIDTPSFAMELKDGTLILDE